MFFSSKDILNEIKEKVYHKLKIEKECKLILYAPTFRKDENLSVYDIKFEKLRTILNEKFLGEFKVLIRLHPRIKHLSKRLVEFNENIIDVSIYDDMQELIIASDVFITDYSSGIFDFALMKKPGFLYATDIDEYKKERGLYYDLNILPFPLATNNKELEKNILQFDEERYNKELLEYFKSVGLKESGVAKEKIVQIIREQMK